MRSSRATTVTPLRALAFAATLAFPAVALAHGGAYRGPAGRVPPDARAPTDPPPPGHFPQVADAGVVIRSGYADWSFSWERRKDTVLARVVAGRRAVVDREEVRRWVVPALRRLLRHEVNFDIASAAAIALARIGDTDSTDRICAPFEQRLDAQGDEAHRVLEETAALALGLLDDGEAGTTRALRAMHGNGERNATYVRPFSAFALAIREQDGTVGGTPDALIASLVRKERKRSARPAALAALGVFGDDKCVAALRTIATSDPETTEGVKLNDYDRAAAIAGLGAAAEGLGASPAGRRDSIAALLEVLDSTRPRGLRREAALALGRAGAHADAGSARQVLERLILLLDAEVPSVEPEHIVQAIGRLGESSGAVGGAAQSFLAGLLTADARPGVRTNAAVALGIAARRSGSPQVPGRGALRGLLARTTDAHERAAYALALGLVADHEAVPALRAVLVDDSEQGELRGYCAVALALLGDAASVPDIAAAIDTSDLPPPRWSLDLRILGCVALGTLGGDAARDALMGQLRAGGSGKQQWELGAAAWGVGVNPDMDAIAELMACALDLDEEAMDLRRALAVTAIGLACAREDAPSLGAIRDALPYRVLPPASLEFLTIL